MNLRFDPLLKVQRELYALPGGRERFNAYLKTMVDPATGDLALPLVAMNPMGKEHLPVLLDEYLRLDADGAAAKAAARAAAALADIPGEYRAALVLSDDRKGGWTNRYSSEFSHRFESDALLKRGWIVGLLWSSAPPSATAAQEAVLSSVFRSAFILRHGRAVTLRQMLAQEAYALSMAGCMQPAIDREEIVYTREILAPHLDAKDRPTLIACLFGDDAARTLGYTPQGLSASAGLALALSDGNGSRLPCV